MQSKNGKSVLKINLHLYFNILILLSLIKSIFSKGNIKTEYNFGNKQNPEIDKSYNHLLGKNVYFITDNPERSMYITAIYPYLTLQVKLKIYTDSSDLINAFNNGDKIFFGFDLMISNLDIMNPSPDYEKYRADIMVCSFSKTDVECHDYIFDEHDGHYKINDDGIILNNNLIPLGFKNIELNYIQKNVMDYKNYFSVQFEKEYEPLFDNITMFNWINFVGPDVGEGIYGFYGIDDGSINMDEFDPANILYWEKLDFIDGTGLPDDYSKLLNKINLYFNLFLIFFLIL